MYNNKYLFAFIVLFSVGLISCGEDKAVFDTSMIPEQSSIPVDKDTSMYDFLGLTEKQVKQFDQEKAIWDELAREIVASEDKASRPEKFRAELHEYELKLYNILNAEQREKFLDYKAYQIERGKPRMLENAQ